MSKWFPVVLLLILFLGLYGWMAANVGFLSDDWELIQRASDSSFWVPIEKHHYSLLINGLFSGASRGILTAPTVHAIALFFHFMNCLLVFFIAHQTLHYEAIKSWILAFLFAINPAGLEAIAWCCAIGYVVCSFWILLGLYLFLQFINQEEKVPNHFGLTVKLIGIQLGAFLSWDWGITFTPVLLLAALVYSKKQWKLLVPLILFWGSVILFKKVMMFIGYGFNPPLQMIKNTLASPFLGLFPQFTKVFYNSPIAQCLAILTFAAMIYTALRNRTALFMALLFFICMSPQIVMGHPQSRYFYLPMFGLYFVVLLFLDELAKKSAWFFFAWIPFMLIHFQWTYQRTIWWGEASVQASKIMEELKAIAQQEQKGLMLVNLPDRYGPEGMIWLPYVWRSGYNQFPFHFDRINTPDCPHLYVESGLAIEPREAIVAKYPQYSPYEIFLKQAGNYREYEIKPLQLSWRN